MPAYKEFDFMARVVWKYHYERATQQQIADEFDVSRYKIMDLLNQAQQQGLIKIQFNNPLYNCLSTELKLIQKFKLTESVVVPTPRNPEDLKSNIGIAGADYLEKSIENSDRLGTTWGTTVYEVSRHLSPVSVNNVEVVLLNGGLGIDSLKMNPYESAKNIASKFSAPCYYLFAPALVDNQKIRDALLSDERIKNNMDRAKKVNKALLGVGDVSDDGSMVRNGYLSLEKLREIRKQGVVGDLLVRFYDIEGQAVETEYNNRVIGLTLNQVKHIDTVIVVAGGQRKIETIYGALKGGYIDVLITDEETAEALLD